MGSADVKSMNTIAVKSDRNAAWLPEPVTKSTITVLALGMGVFPVVLGLGDA